MPDRALLRAGVLLQHRLRRAPASRARSRARSGPAPTCQRTRSIRPRSAWTSWPPPAAPTASATATALPDVRAGDDLPRVDLPGGTTTFTGDVDLRRRRRLRHPERRPPASRTSAARTSARTPAPPTPTAPRPAVCINGSCGLKPAGQACVTADRVLVRVLRAGSAAPRACTGACQSCALTGALGTCTNVPNGDGRSASGPATIMGTTTCSTDGFCDGNGGLPAVRRGGTSCAAPSCPASSTTLTSGRTCDGKRHLPGADDASPAPPTSATAAPPARRPARATRDCLTPEHLRSEDQPLRQQAPARPVLRGDRRLPDGQQLRRRRLLQRHRLRDLPGLQRHGQRGQLRERAGQQPGAARPLRRRARPAATPAPATAPAPASSAGPASPAARPPAAARPSRRSRTATAAGACAAPDSPRAAGRYVCGATTRLQDDLHRSTATASRPSPARARPTKSCALKPNGLTCASANQCISGFCTDGVCCGSGPCGTCQACNVNGAGSCAALTAGTTAPSGQCGANGTCGNTGTCNGSGACTQAATSVSCAAATCTGTTFTPTAFCSGGGSCAAATTSSCAPYVCGGTSCKTTCSVDGDCVPSGGNNSYCTGTGGACLPVKATRRRLLRQPRMRQRKLRRRRLLRHRELPDLPGLQRLRQRRHLRQRRPTPSPSRTPAAAPTAPAATPAPATAAAPARRRRPA